MFCLNLFRQILHQLAVPVDPTEEHITGGADRFVATPVQSHQGHIERPAAEVVNQDRLRFSGFARVVEEAHLDTVGDGRRSGLIDDVQHFQSSEFAGVLRCFAARFVKERGYGDDGF